MGVGAGRLLPISPRVALAHLEQVLLEHGLIDAPLSEEIARQVLRLWIAERDELGHHKRVLQALRLIENAQLLRKPMHPGIAYRLQNAFLEVAESGFLRRFTGVETRAGVRVGYTATSTASSALSLAIEARHRKVWNLSTTTDLWFEPAIGAAPRVVDVANNTLPGQSRVGLVAADLVAPVGQLTTAVLPTGRVLIDVPLNYNQVVLDGYLNRRGLLSLHSGVALGVSSTSKVAMALTLGDAYTMFTSAAQGYQLGLRFGLGYVEGKFTQDALIVASIIGGSSQASYVAPDTVGDKVPFDTSWLPHAVQP